MKRCRLWLYEILSQMIVLLGWARERISRSKWMRATRKDRTFHVSLEPFTDQNYWEYWDCCDCGLQHKVYRQQKELILWPIRPKSYRYRLRLFAAKPAPFVDESQ